MISGSITLNNLTDPQLTQLMEEKDKHEGKIVFPFSQVRQAGTAAQPLNNNIQLMWNDDDGFRAVLDISHRLLGEAPTV